MMSRLLLAKTRRDIRRQLGQFASIVVIVLLGVALFVASWDAFRNLSNSYEHTYDRLHFADLVATGGDPQRVAAAVADRPDVAGVTTRTQADIPMRIGDTKLLGRVIGLPAGAEPAVGQVDVQSGDTLDPDRPYGVLVESHAASTFGLAPGDQLQVFGAGGWQQVNVRGVAISAEYLWPARSRQDLLPDPHGFAVIFAPQPTAAELAAADGPDQVLVELTGPARDGDAAGAVTAALRGAGATDVQPRADQPSNAALHEDLSAFAELAVAFPGLFLSAAAVAGYVLLTRRVLAERPIIGTLLAAGARRGRVVRHYLSHGVLAGLAGAVLGVVAGLAGTAWLTGAYTSAFGIPDTVVQWFPSTIVAGLGFGLLVGAVGSLAPARTVARTAPAEAMRNQVGAARARGRWLARVRVLPVSWRMALRDIGRNRRRTLATMLGTVLALVLVLASTGLMLSMRQALEVQFGQVQRQDATVRADPAAAGQVESALAGVDGVSAIERATESPVTVAATAGGSEAYSTVLTGLRPGTTMHGFRDDDGSAVPLPPDGVLAGASLTGELDVDVGDDISLAAPGSPPRTVRLAGLVDEPLGTNLYATMEVAERVVGNSGAASFLVRFEDGADRDRLRAAITTLPGVVAYTDAQALRATVDDYLGLFWAFVGAMAGLGGILAFTVIYVTMTVNLAERMVELATLRAAGVRVRRIAAVVTNENLVAVALGVPIGLAAGSLAAWSFLRSFNSDLFTFEFVLSWWVLAAAAGGVLLAALGSQLPAMLSIRRLDVARVVRERAQ